MISENQKDLPFDKILDGLFWVLLGGVVGGRILFVIINWKDFTADPVTILALRDGGMAFHGSLIMAIAAGAWACRKNGLSFLRSADLVAPYIALGQAVGRLGCFLNGCCYGKITSANIGVTFPQDNYTRIPVQIYSMVLLVFIWLILLGIRSKKKSQGSVIIAYIVTYSFYRFFVEFLRGDNPGIVYGFTLSQVISMAMLIAGVLVYVIMSIKNRRRING